MYYKILVTK